MARPGRRPPSLRVHATVRRELHSGAAAGVRGLAAHHGAYWRTHLSEDAGEIEEVSRLFPEADYLDVYDRAGGVGERTIFAHAIHLSDQEVARLVETVPAWHCPASNLFLSSGMMPLGDYLRAGVRLGLGSDVAAGPELSMFTVMRAGTMTQRVLELTGQADRSLAVRPIDWLRLGTLGGAAVLGLEDRSVRSSSARKPTSSPSIRG